MDHLYGRTGTNRVARQCGGCNLLPPDTGFTVLDLNSEGELVTVVGVLPALSAGEELRLMGHWDVHASFGRQFRAELCERSLPSTAGSF